MNKKGNALLRNLATNLIQSFLSSFSFTFPFSLCLSFPHDGEEDAQGPVGVCWRQEEEKGFQWQRRRRRHERRRRRRRRSRCLERLAGVFGASDFGPRHHPQGPAGARLPRVAGRRGTQEHAAALRKEDEPAGQGEKKREEIDAKAKAAAAIRFSFFVGGSTSLSQPLSQPLPNS